MDELTCIGGPCDGQRIAPVHIDQMFLHVPHGETVTSYSRERFASGETVFEVWLHVSTDGAEALALLIEHYRPKCAGPWIIKTPLSGDYYKPDDPALFCFLLVLEREGRTVARLEPSADEIHMGEAEARAAGLRFAESIGIEVAT